MRFSWLLLMLCVPAYAAGDARSASRTAQDLERKAARLDRSLADQFRLQAAETLQALHPEMARKFIDATLEELRASKDPNVSPAVVRMLAEVAPEDAVATLQVQGAPAIIQMLIAALAPSHPDVGLALYRSARAEGKVKVRASSPLIVQFARTNPTVAAQLLQEVIDGFSFENLEPSDAWWLVNTAHSAAKAAPEAAADLYDHVLQAVSAPKYGENAKSSLSATFQIGSTTIQTDNARDVLGAGAFAGLLVAADDKRYQLCAFAHELRTDALRGV